MPLRLRIGFFLWNVLTKITLTFFGFFFKHFTLQLLWNRTSILTPNYRTAKEIQSSICSDLKVISHILPFSFSRTMETNFLMQLNFRNFSFDGLFLFDCNIFIGISKINHFNVLRALWFSFLSKRYILSRL